MNPTPPIRLVLGCSMRQLAYRVVLVGSLLLAGTSTLACGPRHTTEPTPPVSSSNDASQAFRSTMPHSLPPLAVAFPPIESTVLDSGFRLGWMKRDTATVSLAVLCRVGARHDPANQSGLAAMMTRMLTEGTENQNAQEQALAIENLGTTMSFDIGVDSLSLSLEVLPEHTQLAVGYLAEALALPSFDTDDFQRIQEEWLDDLQVQRQDTDTIAWLLAFRALLGPGAGRPEGGRPVDVASLTEEDLAAFHDAKIASETCGLLAAGPVDSAVLPSIAETAFQYLPRRTSRPDSSPAHVSSPSEPGTPPETQETPPAPAHVSSKGLLFFERSNAVQSSILLTTPLPPRSEAGRVPRQIVNNLFGGLFTSRLNTNLRERNAFTYGAFSAVLATEKWGAWVISTSVETEVTVPALVEIHAEVNRLGTDLPDSTEAARARTDLRHRQLAHLEHTEYMLGDLAEWFVFELPENTHATYLHLLEAEALATIQQTAQRLSQKQFVTVVVGTARARADLVRAGFRLQDADATWLN